MNNSQFRRLLTDTTNGQNGSASTPKSGAAASTLGAKKSSFMPMTPRTVRAGNDVDFARQVRERNAALHPAKKFKSAAPKGVKYGASYTDRAKARLEAEEGDEKDDKAIRIKALEEQMKLGQISSQTFEALRDEITGGDLSSTHLVKGLDRRLLERVRRGEDVLSAGESGDTGDDAPDVDEELDQLGEKEVEAVQREKVEKKGTMASPAQLAGAKRSRDEIMAELKAQRKANSDAKNAPLLDRRWRKVGEKEKSRVKIDHKGREVVITVDEDGVVKKKVRKVAPQEGVQEEPVWEMPDESRPILGSDAVLPELRKSEEVADEDNDNDDDNIFEGVGTEYDPLGDEHEHSNSDDTDDTDDTDDGNDTERNSGTVKQIEETNAPVQQKQLSAAEKPPSAHRNYFKETTAAEEDSNHDRYGGVQEFLKKAAKMDSSTTNDDDEANDETNEDSQARLKKRAQMLATQDRDFEDMDMGFGSNRYDDGEDEGDAKVDLSEWKGADDDHDGDGKIRDGKKKRKPKKRKGDSNNMADIMRVIEGRNTKGGTGK